MVRRIGCEIEFDFFLVFLASGFGSMDRPSGEIFNSSNKAMFLGCHCWFVSLASLAEADDREKKDPKVDTILCAPEVVLSAKDLSFEVF